MIKLFSKYLLFLLTFIAVSQASIEPLKSTYDLRLTEYGVRYYDPRTSVWQSPDPIIGEYMSGETNNGVFNPKNLQLFTYTYNNPINLVDPNGLETVGEILTNWSQEVVRNDVANDRSGILGAGAVLAESAWNTFGPEAVSKVADNAWNGRDDMTGSDYAWAGFEVATAGAVGAIGKLYKGTEKTRVFWSGSRSAETSAKDFAKANGGVTLEMTLPGKILDKVTTEKNFKTMKPLWQAASKNFAKGAKGPVHTFHSEKGVRLESVWAKEEFPILREKGNDIIYHIAR